MTSLKSYLETILKNNSFGSHIIFIDYVAFPLKLIWVVVYFGGLEVTWPRVAPIWSITVLTVTCTLNLQSPPPGKLGLLVKKRTRQECMGESPKSTLSKKRQSKNVLLNDEKKIEYFIRYYLCRNQNKWQQRKKKLQWQKPYLKFNFLKVNHLPDKNKK